MLPAPDVQQCHLLQELQEDDSGLESQQDPDQQQLHQQLLTDNTLPFSHQLYHQRHFQQLNGQRQPSYQSLQRHPSSHVKGFDDSGSNNHFHLHHLMLSSSQSSDAPSNTSCTSSTTTTAGTATFSSFSTPV
jgi:hypothetical protein